MADRDEVATMTDPAASAAREARGEPAAWLGHDRYRLGELIGHGGMGDVVAARDEQVGRDVAVKRIRDALPNASRIARFEREASIQGRLDHPAIVPVHELGVDADGRPYFAMKKLAGTTLADILDARDPKWGRQRLLRAFVDVCFAIEFAHVHGVLHRDIKPANIMLGEFGEVYVLDWGVAKIIGEDDIVDDLTSDDGLTAAGAAVGTAGYMAPEQAAGVDDLDERADVYALGRVLGKLLGDEHVPELDAIQARSIAVLRDERTPSSRVLADDVQRYLDGDRDLALRRQLAQVQLARARAALAADTGDDARRIAIEAGGHALALDPTLDEAGALVGALVLEPPRTPSAEVVRALEDDARAWARARAHAATRTHAAYLLVGATLIAAGAYAYLVAFGAAVGALFAFDRAVVRGRLVPPPWLLPVMIAPLLVLLSIIYSPALAAPSLAALCAVNFSIDPQPRRARGWGFLFALLVGSVLAPLALGWLGIIAPSVEQVPGGWLLHGPGLLPGAGEGIVLVLYVMVLVGGSVALGRGLRTNELATRTQLHTISWRLRQLLPARSDAPGRMLR
jgi:serine/threonine-protein kinase